MDPRVKTSMADLQKQFDLSNELYHDFLALQPVVEQAEAAHSQLKAMREKATGPDAAKLDATLKALAALQGGGGRRRRGVQPENLNGVAGQIGQILGALQEVELLRPRKLQPLCRKCINPPRRSCNSGRSSKPRSWRL